MKNTIIRFGIARATNPPVLISGREQPGPITFATRDEADSHIKFESLYGVTVVEVIISFDL